MKKNFNVNQGTDLKHRFTAFCEQIIYNNTYTPVMKAIIEWLKMKMYYKNQIIIKHNQMHGHF